MNRRQMILGFAALATASAGSAMAGPAIFDQSLGDEALLNDGLFLELWRKLSPRQQQVMRVVIEILYDSPEGFAPEIASFPPDVIAEAEEMVAKRRMREGRA